MVSCGPDVQNRNFTHMFTLTDYKCQNPVPTFEKGSLYDYLTRPEFSKFREIVKRAGYIGYLSDSQANFTLFAPEDGTLAHIPMAFFQKMDDGYAREIVNACIIPRKIDRRLLVSSPVCYFTTRNYRMRMYVTNIRGNTRLNDCVNVTEFDTFLNNGILHRTNGLIMPSEAHFLN